MSSESPAGKKVGEYLARERLLTSEQLLGAHKLAREEAIRLEEAILELGYMSEPDLLRSLSALYKTQFVSTEKLARAAIDRPTLAMVPKQVCDLYTIFPVMFDPATNTLSLVSPDPDDVETLRNIESVSGARTVRAFVARPRAVLAAIARAHSGDLQAFGRLEALSQSQMHRFLDVRKRESASKQRVSPSQGPAARVRRPSEAPEAGTVPHGETQVPSMEIERQQPMGRDMATHKRAQVGAIPTPGVLPSEKGISYSGDEVLELLNVLVSLLENTRADLRGHSAHVARLMRRAVERMHLSPASVSACVCAALLHDLGKTGPFHLTALNCSEYDGHRLAAQKVLHTPTRLLETVRMPPETVDAIGHMYERYDGKGFPDGQAGKDIPLGARLLSITDTYADLTQNPRNPYRKALSPAEACEVLAKFKEGLFDPNVVDLFQSVVLGEDLKARLLADRYVALLVDPDPEETTVLELRMIEQGFEVKTARNAEQAVKTLEGGAIDLVVSEIDLPQTDGLTLLSQARKQPWGKDLPWVIHTRRQGRAEAQRAIELAVVDFVSKPAATDVLVAKLKGHLDNRRMHKNTGGGVSGSLREMGLPDMVQVLFHGGKTGNLVIRSAGHTGEIHFLEGAVVNASWSGKKGTAAFYELLGLREGEFMLDPSFRPTERVIKESPEMLLLEAMRRLDEGVAG
jgi:response regulator RpfG family c-di-GMP phosphodiesterase